MAGIYFGTGNTKLGGATTTTQTCIKCGGVYNIKNSVNLQCPNGGLHMARAL